MVYSGDAIPTDIWAEIFDHLLYDPILFNPDPLSDCLNPHTALRMWYDYPLLENLERQRRRLRLVSSTWEILAEKHVNQYLDAAQCSTPDFAMVKRVRFRKRRTPSFDDYDTWFSEEKKSSKVDSPHLSTLSDYARRALDITSAPRLTIITLTGQFCLTAIMDRALRGAFPAVRALSVEECSYPPPDLSTAFPNLVLLAWRIIANSLPTSSDIETETIFSDLTTFQLAFDNDTMDLSLFQHWTLPRLRHFEFTVSCFDEEPSTRCTRSMYRFLRTVRESLTGLKIALLGDWITPPSDLWEILPHLKYLGMSTVTPGAPFPPLPARHPLRTMANTDVTGSISDVAPLQTLREWDSLTTLADVHRWDDIPPLDEGCRRTIVCPRTQDRSGPMS